MQSRGCEPERACCFLDRHALAVLYLPFWLEARDLPVRPQARHAICCKRQSRGRRTALAIEDTSDLGVGIMCSQSSQQIDRIVGSADWRWMRVWQWDINFAEESAAPTQRQVSVIFIALDSQGDILEQRAEQLLAIAITRGGSEPDTLEVFTECKDRVTFFARKRARSCVFAIRELGFGRLQFLQGAFPFCFKSTCDESVLRVDGAIASLGALRVVARTLDVATELRESLLVIGESIMTN